MEEAKLKLVHFIVIPFPAQGHLTPLMNLSTTLAQEGALVTVFNIEPVHRQFQSKLPCSSPNLKLVGVPFELDAPTGMSPFWYNRLKEFGEAMSQIRGAVQDLIAEIIERAESTKYVLISDYIVTWCREVAHQCGLLFVNYWPGGAHWFLIHHHLHLLASHGDLAPDGNPDKVITYVPGIGPLKLGDFPRYVYPNPSESLNESEHFLGAPATSKDEWFFINTVYELEPRAIDTVRELLGPRCVPIAPSFPIKERGDASSSPVTFSLKNEDVSCLEWLDKQEPNSVLYVSFGSIAPLSEGDVVTLAEGLELSKQKFLWVVKPEHLPKEHAEIFSDIVLRAKESDRGTVIEWAPQVKVLGHSAVAGFVSHCGWNSVMESITCGVPIICWPCISEQHLNAKLVVEDWKMGRRVKDLVDKQELQVLFTEFMSNREAFARNAAALQEFANALSLNEKLRDFLSVIAE